MFIYLFCLYVIIHKGFPSLCMCKKNNNNNNNNNKNKMMYKISEGD